VTTSDSETNQSTPAKGSEHSKNSQGENNRSERSVASRSSSTGSSNVGHSDSRAGDRPRAAAMEVLVDNNIEKAMKVLKRKLIKEGLFKELKSRRYYEKPSEKKKRKFKESLKKARKDELRQRKNAMLFS
jgi:small subunit ribosomal protein S21